MPSSVRLEGTRVTRNEHYGYQAALLTSETTLDKQFRRTATTGLRAQLPRHTRIRDLVLVRVPGCPQRYSGVLTNSVRPTKHVGNDACSLTMPDICRLQF